MYLPAIIPHTSTIPTYNTTCLLYILYHTLVHPLHNLPIIPTFIPSYLYHTCLQYNLICYHTLLSLLYLPKLQPAYYTYLLSKLYTSIPTIILPANYTYLPSYLYYSSIPTYYTTCLLYFPISCPHTSSTHATCLLTLLSYPHTSTILPAYYSYLRVVFDYFIVFIFKARFLFSFLLLK